MRGICPQERISYCVSFFVLTAKTWCFLSTLLCSCKQLGGAKSPSHAWPRVIDETRYFSLHLASPICLFALLSQNAFCPVAKVWRICKEIGHSCARKICSYVKWPRRIVVEKDSQVCRTPCQGNETWC